MLQSYRQLKQIQATEIVTPVPDEHINGTSIDITLGKEIMVERRGLWTFKEVCLRNRDKLEMDTITIPENGFVLLPGDFILAHSAETFNLPLDLSAEYKLKSSMARIGLEHLNAGWCDPGWHGSCLTLELKNMTRYHSIRLHAGDRIGQMVFFRSMAVPHKDSYATRGRYNGDKSVSGIKE